MNLLLPNNSVLTVYGTVTLEVDMELITGSRKIFGQGIPALSSLSKN